YPRATRAAWKHFWKAPLPHRAHTVLWRFYHNKLPCRARLHQLILDSYPSDSCIFCDRRDTDQHFIWTCP
ncbi:hypothetical protein BDB00DRAFT_743400, partial [Zychaea mexicana]|uniref:uncharacterized protein n=1 Tax=Zychaea mexicana TaxID=64656 RepID=UPI0022FF1AFE